MHNYSAKVLEQVKSKRPWETEFISAVTEVVESIDVIFEKEPKYQKEKILERIVEPERVVSFRVPWIDDKGELHVNTGYRVNFNSAIGPYKGGLRFHPTVTLSILKSLAFEQTFKNALTSLPMGGGKGGADFDPRGRSDREIMTFCQSFMTELSRHIGAAVDVPAGDIGVGGREIGYLFGQYKRLVNRFEGALTGKGINWGGSYFRPEATGYGLVYFADNLFAHKKETLAGKTVAISGFGNVAWGAALKANQLGAKVVTLSGPDGFIYDAEGIKGDKITYMLEMRNSGRDKVEDFANKFKVEFHKGKRPWGVKCDVALPCATQNELDENDAKILLANGCKAVVEGSNLASTLGAISQFMKAKLPYVPGKASNAGGVATSGLEMAQNATGLIWAPEKVDAKLKDIMKHIHDTCINTSQNYGLGDNYLAGANIAGFKKVADAMIDQGCV